MSDDGRVQPWHCSGGEATVVVVQRGSPLLPYPIVLQVNDQSAALTRDGAKELIRRLLEAL